MKIGFTGASGTGKTTLMNEVAKIQKLQICPIDSRQITEKMGLKTPYEVDELGLRREFQYKLFEEKSKWENENNNWISDRTHLDNLVYTLLHQPEAVDENFRKKVLDQCKVYDIIFYFPANVFINIANDPQRKNDLKYQKLYDWLLKCVLVNEMGLWGLNVPTKCVAIETDDLKERISFSNFEINNWYIPF